MIRSYKELGVLGTRLLAFFIVLTEHTTISAIYPDSPESDPPSQWSSMSNNFPRHCSPFGVSVFAKDWPRNKFVHACNMLAQMLDNDQDGCADDASVVKKMRITQSGMVMFGTENSVNYDLIANTFHGQGLNAEETKLGCSGSSETSNCRDAAIEEIMHVITAKGLALAYPDQFGECKTNVNQISTMQQQMDIARGGHFLGVPNSYPSSSIYHYDDQTCDYACMGIEFIYWAITSLHDGQNAKASENSVEWEANTAAQLQSKLPGMYDLLLDNESTMILLSSNGVLPGGGSSTGATGTYNPSKQTCSNGCALNGVGCGPQGNLEDLDSCDDVGGPSPTPPSPTPPTQGDLNGEEACEEQGFTLSECRAVGDGSCCEFDDGECWSKIGQNKCPGTGTPSSCSDSPLRFKIVKNDNVIRRDCTWVSNKNTNARCALDGVSETCPDTCGTCSSCVDSPSRFRLVKPDGKKIMRYCTWVSNKTNRCAFDGVEDTCRSTCGSCSRSIFFG